MCCYGAFVLALLAVSVHVALDNSTALILLAVGVRAIQRHARRQGQNGYHESYYYFPNSNSHYDKNKQDR